MQLVIQEDLENQNWPHFHNEILHLYPWLSVFAYEESPWIIGVFECVSDDYTPIVLTSDFSQNDEARSLRLLREDESRRKKYTWMAEVTEIQRKGRVPILPVEQMHTIKVSSGGSSSDSEEKVEKEKRNCEKVKEKGTMTVGFTSRLVEIK